MPNKKVALKSVTSREMSSSDTTQTAFLNRVCWLLCFLTFFLCFPVFLDETGKCYCVIKLLTNGNETMRTSFSEGKNGFVSKTQGHPKFFENVHLRPGHRFSTHVVPRFFNMVLHPGPT